VWRWVARRGAAAPSGLSVRRAERNGFQILFCRRQIHIYCRAQINPLRNLGSPSAALLDVFVAVFTSCRESGVSRAETPRSKLMLVHSDSVHALG